MQGALTNARTQLVDLRLGPASCQLGVCSLSCHVRLGVPPQALAPLVWCSLRLGPRPNLRCSARRAPRLLRPSSRRSCFDRLFAHARALLHDAWASRRAFSIPLRSAHPPLCSVLVLRWPWFPLLQAWCYAQNMSVGLAFSSGIAQVRSTQAALVSECTSHSSDGLALRSAAACVDAQATAWRSCRRSGSAPRMRTADIPLWVGAHRPLGAHHGRRPSCAQGVGAMAHPHFE